MRRASDRQPAPRRNRLRIVLALGVTLLSSAASLWGATVAQASGTAPDNCTQPETSNNPWFIATGPLAYWWWYAYYGGPANPYAPKSGEACMMWTYNEKTYSGSQYGNGAGWFDEGSMQCGCGYDNSAEVWIPSEDATTKNAVYYLYYGSTNEGSCPVNQDSISNEWVILCNSLGFVLPNNSDVLLTDGTGERSSSTQVGFDAAQFNYLIQL